MTPEVTQQTRIAAAPRRIFAAVADVRQMARWSPECFAVWITRRRGGLPYTFVGWNRRGAYVWFTTCRVVSARPGVEFAFDVTTFGQPVARWGFRLAADADGTTVTQFWQDRRGRAARILGRVFTGAVANARPAANEKNMAKTLARLKHELELG